MIDLDHHREMRGRPLRYLLVTVLLDARRPLTLAEIVSRAQAAGVNVPTPANKIVSDALRWEIGHGRVRRVGRGRYTIAHIPRSTQYYIRAELRAALAATQDLAA